MHFFKSIGRNGSKLMINNRCKIEKRSEMLMHENKDLKQALDDNKKRLEASKARCKVLETECNNIKIKLSTISDQAERDHELITSLMVTEASIILYILYLIILGSNVKFSKRSHIGN